MALLTGLVAVRPPDLTVCHVRSPVPRLRACPDHFFSAMNGLARGSDRRLQFLPVRIFTRPPIVFTVFGPHHGALSAATTQEDLEAVRARLRSAQLGLSSACERAAAIRLQMLQSQEDLVAEAAGRITELELNVIQQDPVREEGLAGAGCTCSVVRVGVPPCVVAAWISCSAGEPQLVTDSVLNLLRYKQNEFVAGAQLEVWGGREQVPRPGEGEQGCVGWQVEVGERPAHEVGCCGQRDFDDVALAVVRRHQPDDLTPADGLLGGGDECARCGYGHVDSPLLGEQPLVAGVVDTCDDAWHRELGLAEQREHEVDLVIAGCRDHDVRGVDAGRLEGGKFAGIGQHPVGVGHQRWPVVRPLALDQQDLVAGAEYGVGDRLADVAGSSDRYSHQRGLPYRGVRFAAGDPR
jgi:hypothetical protein